MAPFDRFDAFQESHKLAVLAYRITRTWPDEEKYGLINQLRRAAFSAAAR